jgi:hypothetical protein
VSGVFERRESRTDQRRGEGRTRTLLLSGREPTRRGLFVYGGIHKDLHFLQGAPR